MDPVYSAGFFFNHTCPNEFIQAGITQMNTDKKISVEICVFCGNNYKKKLPEGSLTKVGIKQC